MELLEGVYAASADFVENAHVDAAAYETLYAASVADPDEFRAGQAKGLTGSRTPPRLRTRRSRGAMSRSSGSRTAR